MYNIIESKSNAIKEFIIDLRLTYFKRFPYLYEGHRESEEEYVSHYFQSDQGIVFIAQYQNNPIGFMMSIPLSESEIWNDALKLYLTNQAISADDCFYYGDVIVLPEFSHQPVGRSLFRAMDQKVIDFGIHFATGLTVYRAAEHSLKPQNYKAIDGYLSRQGWNKTNFQMLISWPTIMGGNKVQNKDNVLDLWIKALVHRK